jgi:RNA 3'-terminal phosphate cyclase
VPFAALARGVSEYAVPRVTEHVVTNLWLVERFGARARHSGDRVRIEGIGLAPGG